MPGTPHTEVRKQSCPPWSWHSGGQRRREKGMERKEENRKGRRGDKGRKRGKEGWRDRGTEGGVEGLREVERQATVI